MKHMLQWPMLALFLPAVTLAQSVTIVQTNADKSALLATQPSTPLRNQSPRRS